LVLVVVPWTNTVDVATGVAAAAVEMMVDVMSVTHPAQLVVWRAMSSHTKVVSVTMGEGKIIKCLPFDWSKA
jgi:hypothetical protein